jgi:hypothetical protein
MPLYTFVRNSLNVLVQIANNMGFQKNCCMFIVRSNGKDVIASLACHFLATAFSSTFTVQINFKNSSIRVNVNRDPLLGSRIHAAHESVKFLNWTSL